MKPPSAIGLLMTVVVLDDVLPLRALDENLHGFDLRLRPTRSSDGS
jgi:hypothetical protein